MFDLLCRAHGIEHRLTKPNHPWTNGQVERMDRTLKEATVRRYHYDSHHQLRQHIQTFLDAYNFAKRLKTLPVDHTRELIQPPFVLAELLKGFGPEHRENERLLLVCSLEHS